MVESPRSIQAILFTDIVNSTARAAELGDRAWRGLLRRHHALVRQRLALFEGREVSTAGDGFLATFNQPAEAIHAACAIRDGVRDLGLEIRGGVHMGEVEWEEETLGGIAVHIGARVAAAAGAGEVLVSSTVRELMAGSGVGFEDRGAHALKGVPGEWRLFAVTSCPATEAHRRRRLTRGSAILLGALTFLMLFSLAGLYMGLHEKILAPGRDRFASLQRTPSSAAPESTFAHRITVPHSAPQPPAPEPTGAAPQPGTPGSQPSSAAPDSSSRAAVTAAPSAPAANRAADTRPPPPTRAPAPGAAPQLDESAYKSSERIRADRARARLEAVKDSVRTERAAADPGSPAFASGKDLEQQSLGAERRGGYEEALALLGRALTAYCVAARPAAPPPAPAPTTPPETPAEAPAGAPAPPPAGAAAETAESPGRIAQGVLAEMRHAIEEEDLGALRHAWVGLSGGDADSFRRWFKGVRDIRVRYDVRSVESAGDGIVATVQTTYDSYNESTNRRESQTFEQVLELGSRDGRWVVVGSRQ